MRQTTFRAMGTDVVVWDMADEAGRPVQAWFEQAEAIFSRFLPTSELTALNASAAAAVTVTETMAACLAAAVELRERTDGLVDPAVGGALVDWGYDRTFVAVVDQAQIPAPADRGTWSLHDRIVNRSSRIRLDLGGIAKGWTCDRAVERDLAAVVSAGGDVRSSDPNTVVMIDDPWGESVLQIHLGVGGLATSSITRRRWKVADGEAHHIIDPRTLAPAVTPVLSATVKAATAVEAEAGAKAVLLNGESGLAWAERQEWIDAALVVWQDGSVFATNGWEMVA